MWDFKTAKTYMMSSFPAAKENCLWVMDANYLMITQDDLMNLLEKCRQEIPDWLRYYTYNKADCDKRARWTANKVMELATPSILANHNAAITLGICAVKGTYEEKCYGENHAMNFAICDMGNNKWALLSVDYMYRDDEWVGYQVEGFDKDWAYTCRKAIL